MSTLSVPMSPDLESFISEMIEKGAASTKSDVVRQALVRYREDQAVEAVLRAERELSEGKVLRGNIRDIVDKMP